MRPRCEQPPSPACAGFAVASARLPRWADPTPRSVPRQSPKAVVLAGFYPRSHLPDLVIPCICPSTMPMWIGGEAQAEAASSSCSCRSGPDDFRSELPPAQAQVVIWYSLRPRHRLLFGTVKEKPHSTCTLLIGATTHGRLRFRCFFFFQYQLHFQAFSCLKKKTLGVDSIHEEIIYSYEDIKSNSNSIADFLACRLD